MVCYAVPTTAAIAHHFLRGKFPSWKNKSHDSLSQLLFGGAIFGIVDHWWNSELFASANLLADLSLGFAITAAIVATWYVKKHLNSSKATSRVEA